MNCLLNATTVVLLVLALFFMIIGWMTLYGTGIELSNNSVIFADQLVSLFTTHIGSWAYFFIAVAAFATMFSTCMTAHDAISRVSLDVLQKLFPQKNIYNGRHTFALMVIAMAWINWIVISLFSANMGNLVALATFVSFVFAPLLGWMNLKTVTGKDMPEEHRPQIGLRILTYCGMLFLSLFALYYCWMLLI